VISERPIHSSVRAILVASLLEPAPIHQVNVRQVTLDRRRGEVQTRVAMRLFESPQAQGLNHISLGLPLPDPPRRALLYSLALFTGVRGRGIFGSPYPESCMACPYGSEEWPISRPGAYCQAQDIRAVSKHSLR
jgi:hypothetical protein